MIGRITAVARNLVSGAVATAPLPGGAKRFYLLDASRALASLAVLFWHYQIFYMPIGSFAGPKNIAAREPLHGLFGLFYDQGHYAVAIFWMISGFVFAAVYLPTRATTRDFVVNRFARLYPLHLLTLLAVALLQAVAMARYGTSLIYENNDVYHFVLQLAFAPAWGFERGQSFNGPIWSVSVEILVYILFWMCHRQVGRLGVVIPALLFVGFFALSYAFPRASVFQCGQYFFLGVALYITHAALRNDRALLAMLVAVAVPVGLFALSRDLMVVGLPGCFGALLLVLVAAEDVVAVGIRKALGVVGDVTYGMYLWHIPLMLVAFLALPAANIPGLADQAWFLLLFLGITIAVARISFLLYERPARDWLRRLARNRAVVARPEITAP